MSQIQYFHKASRKPTTQKKMVQTSHGLDLGVKPIDQIKFNILRHSWDTEQIWIIVIIACVTSLFGNI